MTVQSNARRVEYVANDGDTEFDFEFAVFADDDVTVYVSTDGGSNYEVETDYSIVRNADQSASPGGTITFADALEAADQVVIVSAVTVDQLTEINNLGGFFPQVIERALDKLTVLIQDLAGRLGRMLRVPDSDDEIDPLPSAAARANMYLKFDGDGNPIAAVGIEGTFVPDFVDPTLPPFNAVGDGVVDDTLALQAAIDYCAGLLDTDTNSAKAQLLRSTKPHRITDTLSFPNVNRLHVELLGPIQVDPDNWAGLATDYAIDLNNPQSSVCIRSLDCGKVAAGIKARGPSIHLHSGSIRRFRTYGMHFVSGGNCTFSNLTVDQWTAEDDEFLDIAEWDATGLYLEANDARFYSVTSRWSRYPLRSVSGAGNNHFVQCHFVNGIPDGITAGPGGTDIRPDNPTIIRHDGGGSYFVDCYFDNGIIEGHDHNINIHGGQYLNVSNNVILDEPYIRLYKDAAGDGPKQFRMFNIKASVGAVDGTSGAWGGDYSQIDASDMGDGLGVATNAFHKRSTVIFTTDDEDAVERYMKPGGNIKVEYWVGAEKTRVISDGTDYMMTGQTITLANNQSTPVSHWTFTMNVGDSKLAPVLPDVNSIGDGTHFLHRVYTNAIRLQDPGVDTPNTDAGIASIYIDPADGDLKCKFGDGTVKTIVTDT